MTVTKEVLSFMDQLLPDTDYTQFAHPERKPKYQSKDSLLKRFFTQENLTNDIFKNPQEYFQKGDWNFIDVGFLLLGSEQLEKKLFPPHKSGKTYLNNDNPFVQFCINKTKKFMDDNDIIIIDGLPYSRSVVDARGFA